MTIDDHNATLGNAIFLTWSGTMKDLPKAKQLARRMEATGTTFRGCSFDARVFVKERCPVCGQWGLKDIDTPWDCEEAQRRPAVPIRVRSHWQPKKVKTR